MSRNDSKIKKERWKEWLNDALRRRGWNVADLVRASGDVLVYNTTYNWAQGTAVVSAESALVVAATLGIPASEVLEAASFPLLADAMAGRELRLVGTPAPAADPDILRLIAKAEAEGLPESTVKILIEWWDRYTAEDKARRLAIAEQMLAMHREAGSA